MTEFATATCTGAVLFTDLVGFTEYNDAVGDRDAVTVLDAQARLAADAVHERGRVVKELGDGLMCWFGSAADAIDAALDLLAGVERERGAGAFPLAMRMGLHHGEALSRGDDVVGHTINVGARIADLAGPGELLVSDDAIEALPHANGLHRSAVGPVRVKGIEDPIWIQRVSR